VGEDQRQGRAVLTGRLGGVKVLVMENRDRKTDDDPSHSLFFVEAADRRQGDQERAQDRFGSAGDGNTPDVSDATTGAAQRRP
jgi:hypothetical protein